MGEKERGQLVILAIDALEYNLVKKFSCKNLKQKFYGKTDISEFSEPRTLVLWSSFMTGKNKEKDVLDKGKKEMWYIKIPIEETFFYKFENPKIIDLPGYSYNKEQHKKERELLEAFFTIKSIEKKNNIRKQYNELAFKHHQKIKEEFLKALDEDCDLIIGYFSIADVIGHLNFGNVAMTKLIYQELDEIARKIKGDLIILSDHGMYAIGKFGDHSDYGFWSTNFKDLGNPRITDFARIIKR